MTKRLFLLAAATALLAVPVAADNITVLPGYTTSNLSGIPPALGTCSTSHSLSDTDDLVVCGKLEVDEATYHDDSVTFSDGTDAAIVDHVQETGLGGRLTIGLDETARTMVLCDVGDMATDFGLATPADPTIALRAQNTNLFLKMDYYRISSDSSLRLQGNARVDFAVVADYSGNGGTYKFNSDANSEMTDNDGEQFFLYVTPTVNQSGTAAYSGIKVVATETALGDGSTGTGGTNNLLALGTSTDEDMLRVKNDGSILQTVGALQVSTEAVTCNDDGDTCAYSAAVVSSRLTAGTDTDADTVTVTDGTDGQRRTFTVVAGTDDVVVDIMTNGSAAANVTLDAVGDSVTIEYMATGDTWWIIGSNGL